LNALTSGRYDIKGDIFSATVLYIKLKPWSFFEALRDYIDFQVVVSGHERFGYAPLDCLNETQSYSKENDCVLGKVSDVCISFTNAPAESLILLIIWGLPAYYRKPPIRFT